MWYICWLLICWVMSVLGLVFSHTGCLVVLWVMWADMTIFTEWLYVIHPFPSFPFQCMHVFLVVQVRAQEWDLGGHYNRARRGVNWRWGWARQRAEKTWLENPWWSRAAEMETWRHGGSLVAVKLRSGVGWFRRWWWLRARQRDETAWTREPMVEGRRWTTACNSGELEFAA